MKEFTTAVELAVAGEEEEPIEFSLDGVLVTAYKPKDGQYAMLMTSYGKYASTGETIAGVINFFVGILDEDSQSYITGRLLDRNDSFGLDQVQEIISWLSEEWSGRPTKSSAASTRSRKNGGRSSTAKQAVST